MSARRTGSSKRRSKGSGRVKREIADPMFVLQQQLTRQLQQTVEDTISAVCDGFHLDLQTRSINNTVGPNATGVKGVGAASTADYEMYSSCCKRLVSYIAANMTTSPDFVAQMDRIILACHSKAPERVLRSVATKNVWFHRRDTGGNDAIDIASVSEDEEEEEDDMGVATMHRPPAAVTAAKRFSPRVVKVERATPARRAAARKAANNLGAYAPPPRTLTKRRTSSPVPTVAKRPRNARRSLPIPKYDESEDDDDDEEEEEEEEEAIEDVEDADAKDDATHQPHLETPDELLDFKDAVRDLCYVDKRTPAQTKFFKERLRKAILFVDAQLCKPPPNKVCTADCKKLRSVMCDRTLPCRNKICRVWHDVEVHIDRCVNPHCELKNRIMLRETMHKVDHKRLQLDVARREVALKRAQRELLVQHDHRDRDALVELSLLTHELTQLEDEIAAAEDELGVLTGTKKAYWASLNVVGIELKDDVLDGFPDLAAHYAFKKQAAAPQPKRAAKDLASAAWHLLPQVRTPKETAPAAAAAEPVDPTTPITRRTARRPTAKTFQAMAMDAADSVERDAGDEETKTNDVSAAPGMTNATTADVDSADAAMEATQVLPDTQAIAATQAMDDDDDVPATQDLSDLSELLVPDTATTQATPIPTAPRVVVANTPVTPAAIVATVPTTVTPPVTAAVASSVTPVIAMPAPLAPVATVPATSAASTPVPTPAALVPPTLLVTAAVKAPPPAAVASNAAAHAASPMNNIEILPSSDGDAYAQMLAAAAAAAMNASV